MPPELISGLQEPEPLAGIVDEARRLVDSGSGRGVPVRLIGGIAVYLHVPSLPQPSRRTYKDIDVATAKGKRADVTTLMVSLGYEPAVSFNALNGHRRLLFHDTVHERQLDVFVGMFEMCHAIPFGDRLTVEEYTVPLAELLMMKLQVVELNEKDLVDVFALLHEHEVADHDRDAINADVVARLTSSDWGLWRTIKMNLDRVRTRVANYPLTDDEQRVILERADRLWGRIEAEPKSRKWKLRDRVGDRVRWYEEPDEVR
jgi:hypothetical protein